MPANSQYNFNLLPAMKPVVIDRTASKGVFMEVSQTASFGDSFLQEMVVKQRVESWAFVRRMADQEPEPESPEDKQPNQRFVLSNVRLVGQAELGAKTDCWTPCEEKKLFELHNTYGNKWAKISEILQGRTDNSIKNHFYCTLRKALRRVNRYISEQRHKSRTRQIKNSILSKIIAVAEERFESKLEVPKQLIQKCNDIKNRLIQFAREQELTYEIQAELKSLINDINQFNRAYKKKKTKKKGKDSYPPQKGRMNTESQSEDEFEAEKDEDDKGVTTGTANPAPQRSEKGFASTMSLSFIVEPLEKTETTQRKQLKISTSKSLEFDFEGYLRAASPIFNELFNNAQPSSPLFSANGFCNPFTAMIEPIQPKFKPIVLQHIKRNKE